MVLHASTTASSSPAMLGQARCSTQDTARHSTSRHVTTRTTSCLSCRYVAWRDATSGIWVIRGNWRTTPSGQSVKHRLRHKRKNKQIYGLTENAGHEIDGPNGRAWKCKTWNCRTWKYRTWICKTWQISHENRLHYIRVCISFKF